MTVGISTVNVANAILNWLRGSAPGAVASLNVKLHVGDPGSAGTANPSAVTTRRVATMNAASGGTMTLASMSGSYAMTTTETLTHVSVHSDITAGNFLWSATLSSAQAVNNGDTFSLTGLTVSNTPLAA